MDLKWYNKITQIPHKTEQKSLLSLTSAVYIWCRSVTVSGEAAQEFSLLHNFIDVIEVATVFLCGEGGKTGPSATIFRETAYMANTQAPLFSLSFLM